MQMIKIAICDALFCNIKTETGIVKIPISNILYIESFKKKVVVHTRRWETESYEIKEGIGKIEQMLFDKGFLQIHKSYIVNMQHIIEMKNYKLSIEGGEKLNVSVKNWAQLFKVYNEWKTEKILLDNSLNLPDIL